MIGKEKAGSLPVDVGRLTNGLRTMFFGMSEIFGSIGAAEAAGVIADGRALETHETPAALPASDTPAASDVPIAPAVEKADALKKEHQKQAEPENETPAKSETPEQGSAASEQKESKNTEAPASAAEKGGLTLVDLQKIAGTKILSNRANQTKIQKIITSFGVSKLSDLKESQYEAFMTELAAL